VLVIKLQIAEPEPLTPFCDTFTMIMIEGKINSYLPTRDGWGQRAGGPERGLGEMPYHTVQGQ
jgi:hypothetical protein